MSRTWQDRIVEKPRTFNLKNNTDGTVTLTPSPGTVIQEGTPVNAANMNGIENDITSTKSLLQSGLLKTNKTVMDLELKLKEQMAMNLINKTGIGFYDTFADNSNIDLDKTSAVYDSVNKQILFPVLNTYNIKPTADYTNINAINVDSQVFVGDKIDNLNEILSVAPKLNSITYDKTIPVSIIGNAYSTNSNARPQMLSNGWLVSCVYYGSIIYIRVSKDNGDSWSELCYIAIAGTATGASLTSIGNKIYILYPVNNAVVCLNIIDVPTQADADIYSNRITLDSSQTALGATCSIAASPTGAMTAAWYSKNASYPNSFNVRSMKSIDGGINWTKQDGTIGVDQITTDNNANNNSSGPYVQYNKNGNVLIFYSYGYNSGGYYYQFIKCKRFVSSFTEIVVYQQPLNGSQFQQNNPVATLQMYGTKAGRIWVVWYGKDEVNSTCNNIKISYSDDDGATWTAMQKLTSGAYEQADSSIANDINGNIYVLFRGYTSSNPTIYNVRMIMWDGTSWSSITELTTQSSGGITSLAVCDNYNNFSNPIAVWSDAGNARIAFYGKWTITSKTYDITLENPVTLIKGQILTIYPTRKVLSMKPVDFDTFDNLELNCYVNKINKATIKGNVNNSATVILSNMDKALNAGDKLFINNLLNQIMNKVDNSESHTVSDSSIFSSASYTTMGNGGRKSVRLDNGWLVAVSYDSSTGAYYFKKSIDNGTTWTNIGSYLNTSYSSSDISLVPYKDKIIAVYTVSSGPKCVVIDPNITIGELNTNSTVIDSSQSSVGGCSLTINQQGTELHACWSCKNVTYQNAYNIRYSRGVINVDGSITWDAVTQVTRDNNSSYNGYTSPTIVVKADGKPMIFCVGSSVASSTTGLLGIYYNGSSWVFSNPCDYNKINYVQSNPCAIFVPQSINNLTNGRIWVAWVGKDSVETIDNLRIAYSDDNGVTWSNPQKLTSGTSYPQQYPSITASKNGDVDIVWSGLTASTGSYQQIRKIKYSAGAWGSITTVTNTASAASTYPSTIFDLSITYFQPLFIYKNNQVPKIAFYGTWMAIYDYTLTMQNQVTLTDGQQVPIVDFNAKQDSNDLTLIDIDTEKFIFKGTGLNTQTANISIGGDDNVLNALVYSIV